MKLATWDKKLKFWKKGEQETEAVHKGEQQSQIAEEEID